MKVLHIRLDAPGYSSDGIARAFKDSGIEYVGFNWQQYRFENGIPALRRQMIRLTDQYRPTFVLLHIQNAEVLDLATTLSIYNICPVVNYSFDVRSKEKTKWMYEIAPHITLTAFACQDDVDNCLSAGIKNVMRLQSSCDDELYKPQLLPDEVTSTIPEIVFIGNNTVGSNLEFEQAQERADMIQFLRKQYGNRFGVYGLGWGGTRMVNPMEEINIYNSCKVSITQNQFKRKGYCSDRQWRSIACGAFTICQYYDGLEDDFYESEQFSWSDFDNLKEQIDFYLNNEVQREIVSINQGRDFFDKHTWAHRIQQLLSKLPITKTTNV